MPRQRDRQVWNVASLTPRLRPGPSRLRRMVLQDRDDPLAGPYPAHPRLSSRGNRLADARHPRADQAAMPGAGVLGSCCSQKKAMALPPR